MLRRFLNTGIFLGALFCALPACTKTIAATQSGGYTGNPDVQAFIDEMVAEHAFDRDQLNGIFSQAERRDDIELDFELGSASVDGFDAAKLVPRMNELGFNRFQDELAALLASAKLVVSPDTGPLHLAVAMGEQGRGERVAFEAGIASPVESEAHGVGGRQQARPGDPFGLQRLDQGHALVPRAGVDDQRAVGVSAGGSGRAAHAATVAPAAVSTPTRTPAPAPGAKTPPAPATPAPATPN